MNKKLSILLLGVFVIGLISMTVVTAPDEDTATGGKQAKTETEGNITFGQCVSEKAVVKNTCYQTVKDARSTCRATAQNETEPKPALKSCSDTFKKDLKQCKMDFKTAKKECGKIKHNAFESVGAAFK
ncbi:MAG: hypothetical protein ACP5OA_05205 [Candidatus Woesearchaeota archaeon]